jgi:HK97 family phage portal protein
MKLLGLDISIRSAKALALQSLAAMGDWVTVFDSVPGAWQADFKVDRAVASQNWAVFSCASLIANDISKLPAAAMVYNSVKQIWTPTLQRPVLRAPNAFQTRVEFYRMWVLSLMLHGNTYILKERDSSGNIVALYILDPHRVWPLVAEDGGVYYELAEDILSGVDEKIIVPAYEIIHDRINTVFHPMIGLSPIFACGVAAMQGAAIMNNSASFFQNMSRPSGVLTAPGAISKETAERVKEAWQTKFSGKNAGQIAVMGDGLKYEAMTVTAVDSQMLEQLKFTGETICATFHVPSYKLGLGQMPTVANAGMLDQQYYNQCLQSIIENMELHLTDGLELSFPFEVWFDTKPLLRMDPQTRFESHSKSINGGWMAPNEARREEDMPPVAGGESPYLQQQNYSLAALAKRDAKDDPFESPGAKPTPPAASEPASAADEAVSEQAAYEAVVKLLRIAA